MNLNFRRILVSISIVLIFVSIIVISYQYLTAKGSDDCLVCHEDKNLTMDVNGKKVSLYINPTDYKKAKHNSVECTDCHQNYNPDNLPHNPAKPMTKCSECHGEVKNPDNNVHKNVNCYSCHNPHNIIPVKEFAANQTNNCLNCHNNKNVQLYKTSKHYANNVKCENCHNGGHETKRLNKSEAAALCGKCHTKHQADFNNSIHQVVMKQGNKNAPTCVDCHGSHNIISSKLSIDEKLFPGSERGSAKFVSQYKTSIHSMTQVNGKPAAGCTDCHGNHMIERTTEPGSSTIKATLIETCKKCHNDIVTKYETSAHGKAYKKGSKDAPTCVICHGEHSIKSVKTTDEFSKLNQTELCLGCHQDGKLQVLTDLKSHTDDYKQSAHYLALKNGNTNAATCSDCHGAHEMNSVKDTTSNINKKNVANSCGREGCHTKQLGEFMGSVHQVSLVTKPNSDAPSCVSCHGNHQVMKKDAANNKISSSKGIVQLCSDCHSSVKIIERNNLPTERMTSYLESFHGLATTSGSTVAANCQSCHGNHNIRPSDDTLSSINKKNLPQTCGKCHPGAEKALLETPIHLIESKLQSPALFWITRIYIIMIISVIGGMILHNILDLRKKLKKRKKA